MTRHSSSNGKGKKEAPVQQEAPMEIPIGTQIIRRSKGTTAERTEDGKGLILHFIVTSEGEIQQLSFIVEEGGKKNIMDAATGGIQLATAADIPESKS